MTNTVISEEAGFRLEELTEMYLSDAVNRCISKPIRGESIADVISEVSKLVSENDKVNYFAEATIAKKSDPIKFAKSRLKNGFKTGGISIDIKKPPIWEEYRSQTRNLRYKLHSWVMLDTLLTADEISDCNDFLNYAVDIAHDWIKKYIISKENDEFAWYDMAVGQRATKLPYMLTRLIEMGESKEKIAHFILASEIHLVELSQKDRIAFHSNHGLFQIAGLMSIVKSLPWLNKSETTFDLAIEYLQKMLDEHFTEDGLHKEHSPEYHLFMINHLSALLDSGWINEYPEIFDLTKKVEEAAHWMQTPDKLLIAMGDSKNNLPISERWHSASENLQKGLKFFEKGGFVIHNSKTNGWSQLAYSCQFHSRQHKHADHHNFTYFAKGRQLLVDAGTYTYQYDLAERIYCESTRAHNTVEIDGYNYSRFRKDAFGCGIRYAIEVGPCMITSGEVNHKRMISSFIPNNKITSTDAIEIDVYHRRTFIHYPDRFLAIIDEIESPEEREFIQWNHIGPALQLRQYTPEKFGIHDNDENVIFRLYNTGDDQTSLKPVQVIGQTQPHLQGWISHDGKELVPNHAIGFSSVGCISRQLTVIDTKNGRTGDPYFRTGSNGNYKRFALTQDGKKVDFKFRIDNEGSTLIEAIIDGESFETSVNSSEG